MNASYKKFQQIIVDTKNSGAVYSYLLNVVKPPYDYSDILRWQLAQTVSALDKLVHDLVRVGMLEIYQGRRDSTAKFESFGITLDILNNIKSNPSQEISYIEKQIFMVNGFKAFQDPDKISESLALIWKENHKWEKIAAVLGDNPTTVRSQLKNIVIRRNQIVHEGDYNGYLTTREGIDESDVTSVLSFIEKLGEAIFNCVK